MKSTCKHLNALMGAGNMVGYATCPDCRAEVHIQHLFNNWLAEFKTLQKTLKKELKQ